MRGNKMQETMAAESAANWPRNKTRIQKENEERILLAALEVFSQTGFHGATLDKIASAAMSKPNLLYYFKNKEEIHRPSDRPAGCLAGPAARHPR